QLQLWDTAGQERFRKSMVQHYYRNVHAVLFVYDVTCPASFSSLTSWVEECRQNSLGHEVPRYVAPGAQNVGRRRFTAAVLKTRPSESSQVPRGEQERPPPPRRRRLPGEPGASPELRQSPQHDVFPDVCQEPTKKSVGTG
ncbi:unnamed protein product, partial [Tetraodon nigroviridis]